MPLCMSNADMDRGEVAAATGAAGGAGGHALPPVRAAAHHPLLPGLHLKGRAGPRHGTCEVSLLVSSLV